MTAPSWASIVRSVERLTTDSLGRFVASLVEVVVVAPSLELVVIVSICLKTSTQTGLAMEKATYRKEAQVQRGNRCALAVRPA